MSETSGPKDDKGAIVCHVTRWYYRRMGLLTAMFIGMGLYFIYDGKWGYPKKNEVAERKEWFEREVVGTGTPPAAGSYEEAKAAGPEAITLWMEEARKKQWVVSSQMQEPRWDDFAAPYGWASDPKKYSAEEIEQQFWWGGVVLAGGFFTGILLLLNRNKKFIGHPEHMVMPNGVEVRYDSVFKVDKRKWDNKGLAYAFYKPSEEAASRKAVIDDLKFGGADKVLTRLLENFSGELIEKVQEPEHEGTESQAESKATPEVETEAKKEEV
ncbi:hypothetical protein FEM03_10150 [Phragmitibacter flavus]|uniref:Uncharacterized protein n=1 Tax=Phragmitibacter flavus TaxID=2576071 RepID=A0A5R8KEC9_9BACT|nr:hypothetical protein [Phragmitibacter flavus]TLD70668.1 hypothetical protein FEM03_10150 [Phragmitibacter flavus]